MPATLLLTPALTTSLADAVRRGVPIETAAQAAGISQQTFYEWLKVGESGSWSTGSPVSAESRPLILEFTDQIRRAQAEWEAEHVQAIHDAGSVVGKSGVPEWRARAFLLTNHPRTRARWGAHVQVDQQSTVHVEHTMVKQLDRSDLKLAYDALELPAPSQGSENSTFSDLST